MAIFLTAAITIAITSAVGREELCQGSQAPEGGPVLHGCLGVCHS